MKIYNIATKKKAIITLSLSCYLIACLILPPFYYDGAATSLFDFGGGLFCVLCGWAGLLLHEGILRVYFLSWFANFTYVIAIRHLIKNKHKAFIYWSCNTVGLSLIFAFCRQIIVDEAGHLKSITMASGYYLWVISFLILLIGGTYTLTHVQDKKYAKSQPQKQWHRRARFYKFCRYELKSSPWEEDSLSPSHEIYPCCGAEFGCNDYTIDATITYRNRWIKSGAK